ncbi:MAG TPA: D-glycerate dehydrogenase [Phycisphaerae bacterium]|nr:D-glycerate dehydrogenase [Phycisphaerae bacterium]
MAGSYNVLVTRLIPQPGLELLRRHCQGVEVNPHDRDLSHQELLEQVAGRHAVLCMLTDQIDEAVLDTAGTQCRVFANLAVGYDNIDLAEATRKGVMITNTPGVLTDATAELTWALLLAAARRIVEADRFFRSGRWTGWGPMQFLGGQLAGQTLGILGAGRIGTAVALRSSGFGMKVLYCDAIRNQQLETQLGARRVDLHSLFEQSDYVSMHVNLTPANRHLVDESLLRRMKPTACLVNTSRGPVIDEAALVWVLREGRIATAALDVYEDEPQPAPGLVELDNVVCVPHIGSATSQTREKMAIMAAENITAALTGRRPLNLVNPEVWKD